jgi:hypothetical protein
LRHGTPNVTAPIRMKRTTLLLSAAGGGLLVALLAWAFAPRPVPVELATAAVGPCFLKTG